MDYVYLVIGFIALIKWADLLVSGASSVAKKFWVSSLVIWLTIVAFGTSAPELFVNVLSATKWQTELALWNILGSNIANVLLILWVAAIIYPIHAKSSTIYKEIPYSLVASLAVFFLAFDVLFSDGWENVITRWESLVLLLFFSIFFAYTFWISKEAPSPDDPVEVAPTMPVWKSSLYIFIGLFGLSLWAQLLITSASSIALSFNVPQSVVGLTIIAFGTSLPELATAIMASIKKDSDIAIGSVVGSNIFNILLVLWSTGVVANIVVPDALLTDILIELGVIVLLIISMFLIGQKWTLTRVEGVLFLSLYIAYIWYIIQTYMY